MTVSMAAKMVGLWRAVQVELQGKYSTQRVQALSNYHDNTNSLRVFLVLLMVPLPCFLLITVVDSVPLRPIMDGIQSSQLFFLRAFVSFWIASITAYGQFKHMVPPAPLSNVKIVVFSTIVAGLTVGAMYALTLLVGFPLPFGIVTVSPAWVHLLLVPFVSWMKKARTDPVVWTMLINLLKIMVCQESLIFIYPTYFYIFTTIPESGKIAFSLLLPLMKLVLRGIMAKTVVHLKDEIPQVIVSNVDVFSALFSTYCMQNTPSVKTTCVLMAADALQMCVSLYDIELVVRRMRTLKEQSGTMQSVKVWGKHRISNTEPNLLHGVQQRPSDYRSSTWNIFALVWASTQNLSQSVQPLKEITTRSEPNATHGLLWTIAPQLPKFVDEDHCAPTTDSAVGSTGKIIKLRYVRELRRVLYIMEFVVLINYVEVVIPLIFSAYLLTMYHLPNRAYYEQIASMDDTRLHEALFNVLLYAGLQLVSLIVLNAVLWHKLRISVFRQLAFVLEKQWNQVQNRLILWVFYNVQASLQHFGSDYTLKFAWLRESSTSS